MNTRTLLFEGLSFAALLLVAPNSHAALTVFTTQASFLAAVTAPGVDTFSDFSLTQPSPSPITRNAGPYPYRASSTTSFFGAGPVANPALSSNFDTDVITFFDIGGGANAIGAFFFGSDVTGTILTAAMAVTATDSLGATSMQTLVGAPTSFLGFVSTGTIASLSVTPVMPGTFVFPTVDNLTIALAAVAPVPEAETWSLLMAGLAALAFCVRRRARSV